MTATLVKGSALLGAMAFAVGIFAWNVGAAAADEHCNVVVTSGESIQDAIDSASSGNTVCVAAGLFEEDVEVDRDLVLLGAQAGVDARSRHGDESHVVGSIRVTADVDSVVLDGFKITVTTSDPWANTALVVEAKSAAVRNNIILGVESTGPFARTGIVDFSGVEQVVLLQNDLSLYPHSPTEQDGLMLDLAPGANLIAIDGNRVRSATGAGIGIQGGGQGTELLVSNNQLSGNGDGLRASDAEFTLFLLAKNTMTDNTGTGVNVADYVGEIVEVLFNCIEGNGDGVFNAPGNPTVNAANNWWGHTGGPAGVGSGGGDSVSANVAFGPWLAEAEYTGGTTFAHGEDVVLRARFANSSRPLAGEEVVFHLNGVVEGTATTDASGIAELHIGDRPEGVYSVRIVLLEGCFEATMELTVEAAPSEPPVPPAGPMDLSEKDQCKKGGWRDLGFRNQGQCIRFVNTGRDSRASALGLDVSAKLSGAVGLARGLGVGITGGLPPGLAKSKSKGKDGR